MTFPTGPPQHLHCPECGASVPQRQLRDHFCDWEDWLDYQVLSRRQELESFEHDLGIYLASTRGRFDLWYAARERASRHQRFAA